jgi:lysophospholipase L1-like esterase
MTVVRTALSGLAILFASLATASENIEVRSTFNNSQIQFEQKKTGHVAFIGGSITEMNGYRPMVCDFLTERYPETKFTFTAAGISSTCSTTGAFRLSRDVLSQGPVDLFFVEFAVNDDQDAGHAERECIRGLEGIIRQCRRHNPNVDIVVTYFVNPGMLKILQDGETPLSMGSHTKVAEYYGVTTIHLAREVAERITAGSLTWEVFGGTHPKPAGNRIAADMIGRLLTDAWSKPLAQDAKPEPHALPHKPLDEYSYSNGRFLDPKSATIVSRWELGVPDWGSIPGGKRERFTSIPIFSGTEPGAEAVIRFKGRAIGAFVVAGPDAGFVETSVDGGPFQKRDLYHRFSSGLHYPRTVMFEADLPDGEHELRLRISSEKNKASKGHAVRIIQFVAN